MIWKIYLIVTVLMEIAFFILILIKMSGLLITFVLMCVLVIISTINFFLVYSIGTWENTKNDTTPELTYQEFISLFNTTPERIVLKDNLILYEYHDEYNDRFTRCVSFKTYIDFYKYKLFFRRNNKLKNKTKHIEAQKEFEKQLKQVLATK